MEVKQLVKIPDVLFFQEGPGVRNSQYTEEGIKLLNVANLVDGKIDLTTSNRYISESEAYGKYKHFLCDDGDFIVASSGIKVEYINKKMGFVTKSMLPLCMNTSTIRFKVLDKNRLDIKYFMYYLKSQNFKNQLYKYITGSAQLNFGPSHLKKISFPLCDIGEQRIIVNNMELITKIMDSYNEQLEKYDELVKARFIEMFGDPVSNSKHLPLKTLPQLGTFGRGVSKYRPRNAPELLNGPYPLIQTGDIANAELYIKNYNSTYSEVGLKQSKMWDKGTLCITIAANIAKTAILQFDACFPDSVVGFNGNNFTNNIFVHYWFSFFQEILENQAPESAQKNINLKILSELQIITPDIIEQNKFANFIQQVDKSRFDIKKSITELEREVVYD